MRKFSFDLYPVDAAAPGSALLPAIDAAAVLLGAHMPRGSVVSPRIGSTRLADARPPAVRQAEAALRADFSQHTAHIDMAAIAVLARRRDISAPDLARYHVAPVLPEVSFRDLLEPAGFCNYVPEG